MHDYVASLFSLHGCLPLLLLELFLLSFMNVFPLTALRKINGKAQFIRLEIHALSRFFLHVYISRTSRIGPLSKKPTTVYRRS